MVPNSDRLPHRTSRSVPGEHPASDGPIAERAAGYEQRRIESIWNGRVPNRFPAAITQPSSTSNLIQTLSDAAHRGRAVAIRSGGHDYHGACLRDGGVLVDLKAMNGVEVDRNRREAWVGAGATNAVLSRALAGVELAFPTGHCPSVGIGGYLLGGGLGWNPTEWGPACWSVIAVEAVTVDGERLVADTVQHTDLLWAARGGAAAFPAIATRFRLRLQPAPKVMSSTIVFAVDALPALLPWVAGLDIPGLEASVIVRRPPGTSDRGQATAVLALTGFGRKDDHAEALVREAIGSVVEPGAMMSAPVVVRRQLEDLEGEGGWEQNSLRYYVDGGWVRGGLQEVGAVCARAIGSSPSDAARLIFARGRHPAGGPDVAFSALGSMTFHVYGTWERGSDDHVNTAWVRGVVEELRPLIVGYWAAQADLAAGADRAVRSYTPDKWRRLQEVIARYDPHGRKHGFLR